MVRIYNARFSCISRPCVKGRKEKIEQEGGGKSGRGKKENLRDGGGGTCL